VLCGQSDSPDNLNQINSLDPVERSLDHTGTRSKLASSIRTNPATELRLQALDATTIRAQAQTAPGTLNIPSTRCRMRSLCAVS
jgi:hypothetical protein